MARLVKVRAIVFDLDGTLLDGSGFPAALDRTCAEVALRHGALDAGALGGANAAVWADYWPVVGDPYLTGQVEGADVEREAWRRTLEACGCTDDTWAQVCVDLQRQYDREAYRLYDDVAGALDRIRAAGIATALLTNGASVTQRGKLDYLGIAAHFDAVAVSGELGVAKPDVAIFEAVLTMLGVGCSQAWHVGDSLPADVAGARAAGLRAVWINRDGSVRAEDDPEPHLEIASLGELELA